MKLKFLKSDFAVCKLRDLSRLRQASGMYFLAKTSEELSLVCFVEDIPDNAIVAETGWKAFRVEGPLDFMEVGILARLSGLLAANGIPIFAVSTYDTDYVLLKADRFEEARTILRDNGYEVA